MNLLGGPRSKRLRPRDRRRSRAGANAAFLSAVESRMIVTHAHHSGTTCAAKAGTSESAAFSAGLVQRPFGKTHRSGALTLGRHTEVQGTVLQQAHDHTKEPDSGAERRAPKQQRYRMGRQHCASAGPSIRTTFRHPHFGCQTERQFHHRPFKTCKVWSDRKHCGRIALVSDAPHTPDTVNTAVSAA